MKFHLQGEGAMTIFSKNDLKIQREYIDIFLKDLNKVYTKHSMDKLCNHSANFLCINTFVFLASEYFKNKEDFREVKELLKGKNNCEEIAKVLRPRVAKRQKYK